MKKLISGMAATAVTAALVPVGLGVVAPATAGAAPAAPSKYDVTWMRSNAQTDLAEITIGKIALERARYNDTKMMATVTIANHKVVLQKLETLAGKLGVTLPGSPSATQKKQAAQLEAIKDAKFDQQYDLDQVNGHLISVFQTQGEISEGTSGAVVNFAGYYLPIAQRHLHMAFEDLYKIFG